MSKLELYTYRGITYSVFYTNNEWHNSILLPDDDVITSYHDLSDFDEWLPPDSLSEGRPTKDAAIYSARSFIDGYLLKGEHE